MTYGKRWRTMRRRFSVRRRLLHSCRLWSAFRPPTLPQLITHPQEADVVSDARVCVVCAPAIDHLDPRLFPALELAQDICNMRGTVDMRNMLHHHVALLERVYRGATSLGEH